MMLNIKYTLLILSCIILSYTVSAQPTDTTFKKHIGGPYPVIEDTTTETEIDSLGFI